MNAEPDRHDRSLFRSSADGVSAFVCLTGCMILAGWLFDIPFLRIAPKGTAVPKANAGLGFLLSGISLWLTGRGSRRSWKARTAGTLAFVVVLIGLFTLSEYVFGWNLGIDQLISTDPAGAVPTSHAGRIAPNTAFAFLLVGLSLLLLPDPRWKWIVCGLAGAAGLVSLFAVMEYAYAEESMYVAASYNPITIHTAITLLVLSAGPLIALGDRGLITALDGNTQGGATARRLLPVVVLVLPVLGLLRIAGERRGLYGEGFGIALMATLAVASLAYVVLRNAGMINRAESSRRRAEEALRQAGVYNRSLLEASLDPLVTISGDGKITDVNAATERVTGRSREDLVGTDFSDYFTEPEQARAGYKQVFREGSVQDYPLEVRRRDGHVTPVLYNAAVYRDEAGAVLGVFAAARDVTERKRAEEALARRTEELARSNAELERFAYVASHDLQEPLRMVSSYVQLLARRYRGKMDSDADDFIGYAVDGAERMQRLITDLLAFSRVGRHDKGFEPISLDTVLDQALFNLQVAIEESGAVLTREPLPTVLGDATMLTQVFQNLVGNAIKFRGKEPPRIHVSVRRQAGEWRIAVRDNGIGVDRQYQERIFIIFQRLHGNDYPGTGIGLPIARKIIERHGGRMRVESEPGNGSTFFFTMPASATGQEEAAK